MNVAHLDSRVRRRPAGGDVRCRFRVAGRGDEVMSKRKGMKILIGYDGSECADAALEHRGRAGLPKRAGPFGMTVPAVFLPPPVTEADDTFPFYVPPGVKRAHERAAHALGEARSLAERTAVRV